MADKVQVRHFRADDQAAAAELINANLGRRFGHRDDRFNPDLYDIAAHYANGTFLVALIDAQLVGTGALLPLADKTRQIARMHTHPDFRRSGIATQIYVALENIARELGAIRLVLETELDWDDARAFYQRCGFIEHQRQGSGIQFHKDLA